MKNKFNRLNTDNLSLKSTKIDLWQYQLNQNPSEFIQFLNPEEIFRANRYHFEKHRTRFTNARGILRIILAKYLQQNPSELCFHTNKYGKPGLNHSSKIQFNLSHSKDLALLAVGCEYSMGVDLEYFSERPFDGIAKNMFSEKELAIFLSINNDDKQAAFYHVWAQKEAFIKACGLGLSYPTQTFSVAVKPNDNTNLIYDNMHNTPWTIQSFMPNQNCYGAICYDPKIKHIHYGII